MSRTVLILTPSELDSLPDYSCSVPTGTTVGKRWRRRLRYQHKPGLRWGIHGRPPQIVGEYVEHDDPGLVAIRWHDVQCGCDLCSGGWGAVVLEEQQQMERAGMLR